MDDNLQPSFRDKIENISNQLQRKWRENRDYKTARNRTWEEDKIKIVQNEGFNWISNDKSRLVCGVSKLLRGQEATSDLTSVVVKFEPTIDNSWDPTKYKNQHEIRIWNKAKSIDDLDLFGSILDYDDDGKWIVMKEYIPVYASKPQQSLSRDYLIERNCGHINNLKKKFNSRNWYEQDWKNGNVGYDHREECPVLIDYGSFTKYID